MNSHVIKVENLGKQYHIGALQKQHKRLGDQLADMFVAPFRRTGKMLRGRARSAAELDETIWALKNVSLEIGHGEVVGIIGRNGAGKSTLLKLLSRITEPTEGRVRLHGRVGSLLEVGTGFHPELTGRENVYLNGAILGMSRGEIDRKFDEILAFAEIEKFVDTPVKHYSSGMYVRLAFSVAAHLEPEILLVDEVLAVGDLAFQKKCLGKMDDVAGEGRTVLFVSHNMGLIQTLCQRGVFLDGGRVQTDTTIREAVEAYLSIIEQAQFQNVAERQDRDGKGKVRLISVEVGSIKDGKASVLRTGNPARFAFQLSGLVPGLSCDFFLYDSVGQPLASFRSAVRSPNDSYDSDPAHPPRFVCDIDRLLLVPGRYRMDVAITGDQFLQDFLPGVAFFDVEGGDVDGRPVVPDTRYKLYMTHHWTVPGPD